MKTFLGAASLAATLLATSALASTAPACNLGNGIKHVVYLQFDNTHFQRDNANVPSDLEQMPHLLQFIRKNGTLLTNDHTQLISHTANGILTSETGVYPDRSGAGAIANSFQYYNSNTQQANNYSSSFVYWTNQLNFDTSPGGDSSYILVNENGQNASAPWAAFTRAGCDFGAAGIADLEFENTSTDIATAFGTSSPEYAFVTSNKNSSGLKQADFEGIAIHCAQGSPICAAASSLSTTQADGLPLSKATPDALPQEPGGYTGFQAVFGHRYAVPALQSVLGQTTNGQLYDYQGNLIGYQTAVGGAIVQSKTISGFPGFGAMPPFVTLSYVETMLKAGVPVVYGYFNDAHDHAYGTQDGVNPAGSSFAYGPGQQGYVNQLQQYDAAFATFLTNLSAAGIDQTNTLFVILVEEGDKFAGNLAKGCDGIHTACTYPPTAFTQYNLAAGNAYAAAHSTTNPQPTGNIGIGEVDVNFDQLLAAQKSNSTPFFIHTDQAPAFYLNAYPTVATNATLRQFQHDLLGLTYQDPYISSQLNRAVTVPVISAIADQAALAALHMVTGDPLRTPSFVAFNNDDVYGGSVAAGVPGTTVGSANPNCYADTSFTTPLAVCTYRGYAWNHGGYQSEVRQTWTSFTGPGVNNVGIDNKTWTDHVDVRATMFALLGLKDDYLHDGRVVSEILNPASLPATISGNLAAYEKLSRAYKQLNAPFGNSGLAVVRYATAAIASNAPSDATYTTYLTNITGWTAQRDTVAHQIRALLNSAEQGASFDVSKVNSLVSQANTLTNQILVWAGPGN